MYIYIYIYIYICYIMFLQQTLIVFATENWTFHITFVFQVLFCIIEINLIFKKGYTL